MFKMSKFLSVIVASSGLRPEFLVRVQVYVLFFGL